MSDKLYELTAKTFQGLEKILASELKKIGAQEIKIIKRAVTFQGDLQVIYKANYCVRTALNILIKITSFQARTNEELYQAVKKIKWEKHLKLTDTFSIDRTVYSNYHSHSHYAALKTKDAIADHFTEKYQQRPSVNTKEPDKKIHLHISGQNCTLSLDSSGEPLFKRKYRRETEIAPLNEILAAGLVMSSDYKGIEYFYDPMCGSGTILIEAARIFMNIPPQYSRKTFAFQKFENYDYKLWNAVKRKADKKINKAVDVKFIGTDISEKAVAISRRNISSAGLRAFIQVETKDFLNTAFKNKKGLIITNPPYDIRIQSDNISRLYKEIADTLKQGYPGWDAYIFSGNKNAVKHIGLKASRKIKLFNGKIECLCMKYEIY